MMWRFPVLSKTLGREGLALAAEPPEPIEWEKATIYDDHDFPTWQDPCADFGGGD